MMIEDMNRYSLVDIELRENNVIMTITKIVLPLKIVKVDFSKHLESYHYSICLWLN